MQYKGRKSYRLADYDYSQNGMYFLTICTKDRHECFGNVINGEMRLSDAGKIAEKFWMEIPLHFPFVNLDEFIVMPNHLHGIIEILKNESTPENVETRQCLVPTIGNAKGQEYLQMAKISPKPKSLPTIIGSYKSIVAKTIHSESNSVDFYWQSRYYDHIIRNETSLNKIREYIITNPEMWERDRNNIENIWI